MRRVAVFAALTAAILVACGSFGADSPPAAPQPPVDSGVLPTEAGSDETGPPTPPTKDCVSRRVEDNFERDATLAGAWSASIVSPGTGRMFIDTNSAIESSRFLTVEGDEGGVDAPGQAMLSTGPFTPPAHLHCSMRFRPGTGFDSIGHNKPIDLFIVKHTYASGNTALFRASYANAKIVVRVDVFDPSNHCLEPGAYPAGSCPKHFFSTSETALSKDNWGTLDFDVTPGGMMMTDGTNVARNAEDWTFPSLLGGPPESAELLLGILNFSGYAQVGYFDDVDCKIDCP